MEQYSREMLDSALLTFHAELGRYDWVPSTALAGGDADAHGQSAHLHPVRRRRRGGGLAAPTGEEGLGMCGGVCQRGSSVQAAIMQLVNVVS